MTRWISFEGLNGVGKTWLAHRLSDRLGPECLRLDELTDSAADTTAAVVISALASGTGTFLRTGHPVTETFALTALKVREYEQVQALPAPPALVLEDRGVDTVAVYQAAILAGPDADPEQVGLLADTVAAIAAPWRPPADLVVLLTDDVDVCIGRFEARTGQAVNADDRKLLAQVGALYTRRAAADPARWRICPMTGRQEDAIDEVQQWCEALLAVDAATGGRR